VIKKIIYLLARPRAKNIAFRILPLLEESEKIIDIGAGTCNVTEFLIKSGKKVTPLDVKNLSFVKGITPILYDGERIPFADNSSDAALLICVLHHAKNPENLLREAKRVAKKIIVIEDVYHNRMQKMLSNFFDNLLSLEFFKNPHSNKTDKEWKQLFNELGFQIEHCEYYRSFIVFNHALYELLLPAR
jgi:ubiquinone/menaquinone biosynthesis C-methylase UbiE